MSKLLRMYGHWFLSKFIYDNLMQGATTVQLLFIWLSDITRYFAQYIEKQN